MTHWYGRTSPWLQDGRRRHHGLPVGAQRLEAREEVLEIRAAQSASERSAANRLIERMYATRGYNATPLPARDSATMRTFVATDCTAPVGTLTVRLDSAQGLAADELFPDEVDRFRAEGARVCEFTKLAMDRSARSPRLLASLFHVAYLLAHRLHGCRYLIIEVNPRHVRYYETMLGFTRVGGPRHNQRVDAPAVLLALDLRHAKEQIRQVWRQAELVRDRAIGLPVLLLRG